MSIIDELITDRGAGTYYNTSDINRVNEAILYIADKLKALGYPVTRELPTDWQMEDELFIEDMDRVIEALNTIKANFGAIRSGTYPQTYNGLTFEGANDIERFLETVDRLSDAMQREWINKQCGTFQSGGVLL